VRSHVTATHTSLAKHQLPREWAGSVEMTRVFKPLSASNTPQLAAEVVLPDIAGTPGLNTSMHSFGK
jgi:hypothetical protein